MVLHLIRVLFLLVVMALTITFAFQQDVISKGTEYITIYIVIPTLAACLIIMIDMFWRRKNLGLLCGLFFGLLAGLIIAGLLIAVVTLMFRIFYPSLEGGSLMELIKALIGAGSVFLCVTAVMQTKDDFRFIIPYVEFSRQTKGAQPILLDTSVIIDGRIADIVDTKIFQSELIVPRFVLAELQSIADSADKLKRNRGRRGLDILQKLQENENADIQILDVQATVVQRAIDVDAKLIALAEHLSAWIMTNDYNLNKIAQLRGIDVLNINDLSNALKPVVLPGERMTVKIIRPGEELGQGVGYLDDGTMVVVEQGRHYVGQEAAIVITSALQTSAGRMIFGKIDTNDPEEVT